ncbi:hypothetical protein IM660_03040 [Ruania alkalisoli]|uniref:Uncharacterized protein n=1 Tax=Ruania alkalisoli TaxID=2779775 RepID=A0A7M1SUT5_9MICO|nr:hypothetical protein [Ruania alkalisoli]QOR71295.1 hypothetical protein IM660_03040 [Ruania alkalisoli]
MRKPKTTVEEWARTEPFVEPIRWGEIEDAVLSRRLPPRANESLRGLRLVIKAVVFVLALAIYGAGAIGLAAVLLASAEGASEADPWHRVALIALLVAVATMAATMAAWLGDGRRRGPWDLIVAAVTGVGACGAGVVIFTRWSEPGVAGVLAAIAGALGVGGLVALLMASTGRNDGRRRWSIDPVKDRRYLEARRAVLQILIDRGYAGGLSRGQLQQLETAPFGSWHEFDHGPGDRG